MQNNRAAAKCHLRLDLLSFLPRFAVVDTAGKQKGSKAKGVTKAKGESKRGQVA